MRLLGIILAASLCAASPASAGRVTSGEPAIADTCNKLACERTGDGFDLDCDAECLGPSEVHVVNLSVLARDVDPISTSIAFFIDGDGTWSRPAASNRRLAFVLAFVALLRDEPIPGQPNEP